MREYATSKSFSTRPTPWTSIEWGEKPAVMAMRSREISTGYWKVMLGLSLPLLTQPLEMPSCQTTLRSHCWLTRSSAAWDSVLLRYAGRASESCFCRADRYAGEQSSRVLFQRATNLSSKGLKRVTRWMKPVSGGECSVGSLFAVGSSIVDGRVSGRCR